MTFLNPLVLFGLAAAALPVILHLLHRRRLRVVEFSTLRFLKEIQHSSLRRVRVRQWLLLVLRTLLIIALVFAFARPVLQGRVAGGAAPRAATAFVLLLDDSPSMNVRTSRGALFDQAKEAAAQILATATSSDRVAILPLSTLKTDSTPPQFQPPGSARARLDAATPSDISAPVTAGLSAAALLLGPAEEANREIYLITDGQATQFKTHPGDSLPRLAEGTRAYVVLASSGTTANAGIVRIQSQTLVRSAGRPALLAITIRNYGDAPLPSVSANVYLDGARVAQQAVPLSPRSTATLMVRVVPRRSGILTGSVEIEEDALELDNRRPFVLTVPAESRATIAGPRGDETRFLRLALTLGGDSLAAGKVRLHEIPGPLLSTSELASTDVLVMAGINLCTPAQGSTIASFLRRGGGVILFPGAGLDAESYRHNLWEPLALPGWLPRESARTAAGRVAAGGTASAGPSPGEQAASFARIDYDHPLLAGLFADTRVARSSGSVESPLIARTAGLRADPRGHSIITLTNGEVFLSELRAWGGTMLVFGVEAGMTWSDFPVKGIFAPLLHRAVSYLTSFAEDDSAVTTGLPLRFRLRREPAESSPRLLLRTPEGVEERISLVTGSAGGRSEAVTSPTMVTGLYRLLAVGPGDSTLVAARAAVMPEPEGDLTQIGREELSEFARVLPVGEGLEERIRESRIGTELWLPFLLLAAVLAGSEMWLARAGKEAEPPR